MTARPDELVLMTGSYALDAVDDAERARMDAFLDSSSEARAEVSSLQETALLLAYAVEPIQPPRDMKSALMAKIATTPQRAPLPATGTAAPAGRHADTTSVDATAAPEAFVPSASVGGTAGGAAAGGAAAGGAAETKAQARWFRRPVAVVSSIAAAVAIIVAGGLGVNGIVNPAGNGGGAQVQASSTVDKIYAAADFQRATTPIGSNGGTATVVWSDQLHRSAVIFKGVAAAPSGKTYELWYIGAKTVPAGTVDSVDGGTTTVVLKGSKAKGDTIGVTVEPAGGSKQPTTKPIVAVTTTA